MKMIINLFRWILLSVLVATCIEAVAWKRNDQAAYHRVTKRNPPSGHRSPLHRLGCGDSPAEWPSNRVNTTTRLNKLREMMASAKAVRGIPVKAYVITSDDEHQSESVSKFDQRRHYITGFTGSAGIAVVTDQTAALWTDGRYFLQADMELDCNWILMKSGQDDIGRNQSQVPTVAEWLKSQLRPGDRVGADPKLVGADQWTEWRRELGEMRIPLDPVHNNLVDAVWNEASGRPSFSHRPAFVHDVSYAGATWQDKVAAVRAELDELEINAMIVTALDEVAWLLNIRGTDIDYMPVIKSYVFISPDEVILFANTAKLSSNIRKHFNSDGCAESACVEIRHYDQVFKDLPKLVASVNSVLLPSKYAYSGGASFAVYELIPADKRRSSPSPIIFLKAKKNDVEVDGMKNAHLKDAVALCDFMSLLQEEVSEGKVWDELNVVSALNAYRKEQPLSRGPSFETIAAFGANGAVIHYRPSAKTNKIINNSSLLLLDSGGQYLDGTTDVTRTFTFGSPTAEQKDMYTRVLMGFIDLASLSFPDYVDDTRIDIVARQHLYAAGVDYLHGTGHGIGAFLGVHESPSQVRIYGKVGHQFEENYFLSDEPGYYKKNDYGIRLESILRVVRKTTPDQPDESAYLGFEIITLVPFEPSLIVPQLMTHKQIQWLNQYHALVRVKVGEELKRQNRMRGFYWLMAKTRHISEPVRSAAATSAASVILAVLLQTILASLFYTAY